MHTASRGGGDGGGGGGGGRRWRSPGEAVRLALRHGHPRVPARGDQAALQPQALLVNLHRRQIVHLVPRHPRQLAAVDAQRIDRQHARVAARVRLRRQHWPARLQAAAPARREVGEHRRRAEPDTSDLTHALGGRPDKGPRHARQRAAAECVAAPAPPKIGWQAPRWLSRLSHVHGSPFTAGHVTYWSAPRRRRRAVRMLLLATSLMAEGRRSRRSCRRDSRLHSACNSARRRTSGARRSRRALRRRAGCALRSSQSAADNSAARGARVRTRPRFRRPTPYHQGRAQCHTHSEMQAPQNTCLWRGATLRFRAFRRPGGSDLRICGTPARRAQRVVVHVDTDRAEQVWVGRLHQRVVRLHPCRWDARRGD